MSSVVRVKMFQQCTLSAYGDSVWKQHRFSSTYEHDNSQYLCSATGMLSLRNLQKLVPACTWLIYSVVMSFSCSVTFTQCGSGSGWPSV